MAGYGKHKDMRTLKSQEIKKSLTHRARLRKSYFKLMEKEGVDVPKDNEEQIQEKKDDKTRKLTHPERLRIVKDRKKGFREEKLKEIQEKKKIVEQKQLKRERTKQRLTQKTRTGQPLMGPRITNLLEKIKTDMKQ